MTFKRSVAEDWFDSFELYLKEFFLFKKKENDYFYFKCHHKDINMFNQIIYLIYVECNFYSCGRFMGGPFPPPPPHEKQLWSQVMLVFENGSLLQENGHLRFHKNLGVGEQY